MALISQDLYRQVQIYTEFPNISLLTDPVHGPGETVMETFLHYPLAHVKEGKQSQNYIQPSPSWEDSMKISCIVKDGKSRAAAVLEDDAKPPFCHLLGPEVMN